MKNINYQALVYANLIDIGVRAIQASERKDKAATVLQSTPGALEQHIAERMALTINKKAVPSC